MQTLSEIKSLLSERGLRPKHSLGQNYLHDHNQLKKLVAAAGVQRGDLVLEVGPGTGTLTETLLAAGARVVACELDRDMAAIVTERAGERMVSSAAALGAGQVFLVQGDCLDSKHAISARVIGALQAAGGAAATAGGSVAPFSLVANLPYQAATPLMATLLEQHPECRGQFVTIQREVADRLTAAPGTREYGPLSVTAQLLAEVELIGVVPPGCFWPAPKVTSAMVALRPRARVAGVAGGMTASRPVEPWEPFARFVQHTFSQRRKQIGSTLGRDAVMRAGFDPQRRAETLAPQEWIELYERSR